MASFARRILSGLDVATLVAMEARPRGWGWIGRLQPRTFDRLLVGFLLSIGLINAILDLRFAERVLRFPFGAPTGIAIPFLMPVVTDGRLFSQLGIQTYGFLPIDLPADFNFLQTIHAADERIPVASMEFGTQAIYEVLKRNHS